VPGSPRRRYNVPPPLRATPGPGAGAALPDGGEPLDRRAGMASGEHPRDRALPAR
jgi:hypothetical protein